MSPQLQTIQSPRLATAWLTALLLPLWTCAAERTPNDAAPNPMGGGGSVVLEPVPARPASGPTQRVVFTCIAPGLTTFSDRPCGPLPERRELQLLPATVTRGGETASVTPPRARASTRPATSTRDGTKHRHRHVMPNAPAIARNSRRPLQPSTGRCVAGYSAREAPRLWDRWRDAKERLRAAGCG